MTQNLVSVILPAYNRTDTLAAAARSVLAQSHRELELIIVDDGSDISLQATAEGLGDDRIRYLRREVNGGPAAARNTGIANARGRWLAFQDSDDEWLLDKLEIQLASLQPAAARSMSIGTMLRRIDTGLHTHSPPDETRPASPCPIWLLEDPRAYTQTWLLPTEVVKALGGFDPELRMWEDWELLIRLSAHLDMVPAPGAIALSERRDDSLSARRDAYADALRYILHKHANAFASTPNAHGRMHYLIGLRELEHEHTERAYDHFRAALLAQPSNLKAWPYLLFSRLGLGNSLQTLRALGKYLRLPPHQ